MLDLQKAGTEDQTQSQLLSPRHGERHDLSHRKSEQTDISDDLNHGIPHPPRLVFEAYSVRDLLIPKCGDWVALKDSANNES